MTRLEKLVALAGALIVAFIAWRAYLEVDCDDTCQASGYVYARVFLHEPTCRCSVPRYNPWRAP